MNKLLLSCFLFLIILSPVTAQEIPEPLVPTKRVTFGNQQHTSRDGLFFSEKNSRGDLIIAGYTERDFSFTDVQVMSLDSDLNLLWSDRLSWDGISYDYPMDLLIDKNDYTWIISKNVFTGSQANFVITRYSPEGEKLWEYKSPETVETSTLNMNQYFYFFDEEGYLNFNYVKGQEYNGVPTFFRLSPSGEAMDEYQVDMRLMHLSFSNDYYQGFHLNDDPLELYYVRFNQENKEKHLLNLTEDVLHKVLNSIYEESTTSVTDENGNLIMVSQGNFHNDNGYLHKGSTIFSITPSGELNYYQDHDGSINKYLLGTAIIEGNKLVVLSNTQPITAGNEEPLLTLEIFSEEGELLLTKKSETSVGNLAKLEKERILLRTLSGNLEVYDYDLNLLSEYKVPSSEEIFVPQDIHLLDESPYLTGTNVSARYEGSDYNSEENYLVRKFDKNGLSATYGFNGEGTSKLYTYSMVRDEAGDYLVAADEFLGPNNISLGGSRAPRERKVLRYSPELEFLEEKIVEWDFELWTEPDHLFKAENGDQYRYEITEDRKAVNFYLNEQLQWQRTLNFDNDGYVEINYANRVDKEGNFIATSSRFSDYAGRIHRLTPQNDYSFIETGGNIQNSVILGNNWIFTFFDDFSIKVYSPQLKLINANYLNENDIHGENYPYLIEKNNKVLFNVRHRNLVMVFDQYGNYESEFALEGSIHPSVAFFDENDALNVYHTIGNGIYLAHGHNWSRGAISRYSNIIEDYIGELPTGDSDGDGISDFEDQCPNTPSRTAVDETGCALMQLPFDNFSLATKDETCKGKNNGVLSLQAKEEHIYIVEMEDNEYSFSSAMKLESLSPGNHSLCITVEGEEQTRQCFEFTIEAGKTFDAQMTFNQNITAGKVAVRINEGSAPFLVTINNKSIGEFNSKEFDVSVQDGDKLEISSANACEGTLKMNISLENQLRISPNPAEDFTEIILPYSEKKEIWVEIYNSSGQLIESGLYKKTSTGKLELNSSSLLPGIYFVRFQLDKTYSLKFIKK